jgi:hypothetical protein
MPSATSVIYKVPDTNCVSVDGITIFGLETISARIGLCS